MLDIYLWVFGWRHHHYFMYRKSTANHRPPRNDFQVDLHPLAGTGLHPAVSCSVYKVSIHRPSYGFLWSYITLAGTRPAFKNFSAQSAVSNTSNVPCQLLLSGCQQLLFIYLLILAIAPTCRAVNIAILVPKLWTRPILWFPNSNIAKP